MAASESEIRVQGLYVAYYGRRGEPAGVEYWTGVLDDAGGDVSAIVNAFGNSQEYLDGIGSGSTAEQVTALYQQMFDRDPDQAGLDFWVGEIDSGVRTLGEVALAIAEGAQGEDQVTYEEKVMVATYFTVVQEMYVAYYGRPGDIAGVEFWALRLGESGGDMNAIIDAFGNSQEFLDGIGTGSTTEQVTTLYQQMFNRNPEQAGLDYWVDQVDSGVRSLSSSALAIAEGAQNNDMLTLENKIEPSANYWTDRSGQMQVPYEAKDIGTAQANTAAVTYYPVTTVFSKFSTDAWIALDSSGADFPLTVGVDNITGTLGDDVISGVMSSQQVDTVNFGDFVDGKDGTDTLKIETDFQDLSLADTVAVKNVEKLWVVNSANDWNSIDIASLDFDQITLDEGGKRSAGLEINNVNSATVVELTKVSGRANIHTVNFNSDATSAVGNTTVLLNNVNLANADEQFKVYASFSAANAVYTTVRMQNINDRGNDNAAIYQHFLQTGASKGVAVNTTFDIETVNTSGSQYASYAGLEVYQAGQSVNNIIVNMVNSDNVFVDLKLDPLGNGTSKADTVTLNLDSLNNSTNRSILQMTDIENLLVNVVSDSEIGVIRNLGNGNSSVMGVSAAHLNAVADLTVDSWIFSGKSGDSSTLNITGSGDVTVNEVSSGNNGLLSIVAESATGDISLRNISSKGITSITTGVGDDSIKFVENNPSDFSPVVQANGGEDIIQVASVDAVVRYVAVTDSQLKFSGTQMNGFDVLENFFSSSDIIELSSSLGLNSSGLQQKGSIGGTTAASMKAFIGDGLGFFANQATAFAHDGTNGYLYVDTNNDGNFTEASDMMIQLAGVTTFVEADINFA